VLDTVTREPIARPRPRRRRTLVAIAALCLVALLGVVLYVRVFHVPWLPTPYRGQDTLNDDLAQVVTDPSGGAWAVGVHFDKPLSANPNQVDSTFLLQFEQGTWVKTYILPDNSFDGISSVAMLFPHEGWAVGQAGASGLLVHYQDGSGRLQAVHVAGVGGLLAVAMISHDEGWAVGGGGSIFHYSGGAWTVAPSPTTAQLRSIAMISASDGWAVGESGTILHYTGGTWSTVASPTDSFLYSVAMVSANDGWAVGEVGQSGFLLRNANGKWTEVPSPADAFLTSVSMASADEGWAVGDKFNARSVIFHYTAGTWQTMTSPTSQPLESVAAVSASNVWAVGLEGTILHYNGAVWSVVNGPS
jgi:photosystem II stability/assembly factor-like uncharacterized protein